MSDIEIRKLNEVHAEIRCDDSIAAELSDHFSFAVPGAQFSPKFRSRVWDGKIRLFNRLNNRIYTGLVPAVVQYAENNEYTVEYAIPNDFLPSEFSIQEANEFIATLKLPKKYEVRSYQLEAFVDAVRNRRVFHVCPTASGKSLIMYLILMYAIKVKRLKTNLVVVPNVSLVKQLANDFRDYGCKEEIQEIHFGSERFHTPIIVTTWQSASKLEKRWFDPFDLVIGDEGHMFKAKSLVSIMEKLPNCMHRVALTGTLDGSVTNKLVLQGLFGKVRVLATTKELQDKGYLAKLEIKALMLLYPQADRDLAKKMEYPEEVDFLINDPRRNRFLSNLALSLNGNTIVLFRKKVHGKLLYELVKSRADPKRDVYFIDGDVEADSREKIRKLLETKKDAIAVVSYGTFSVGINVVHLDNIVFGSPSKERVRVLQSIGRGLRKGGDKTVATLYDIVDDLSWKVTMRSGRTVTENNYMLKHFRERLGLYTAEQFPYKIYTIGLE